MEKEYVIPKAVNIQVLAAILGREVGPVPTIYLGYVDGFQIWNSVLKRCEKWLAIWKSETQSMKA